MRTPTLYPGVGDGVRLYPGGVSFKSAVHVKAVEHGRREVHVWRCAIDDFSGKEAVYLATVVWPKVWHKATPFMFSMYLHTKAKPKTPEYVIAQTVSDLDKGDKYGFASVVADSDAVFDARDPEPRGRGN